MPSEDWVCTILSHADSTLPTLGRARLICIDGLAGAGKTTLATDLAAASGAALLHTDHLLEGWSGLPALGATLERLVRPLAAGRSSTWRRWDWHTSTWAEEHVLAPAPLLVVEGVGAGASAYADLITTLVWVEADRDHRLRRGLARDGEDLRVEWLQWLDDEAELHARERTRERADLLFSTSP